MSVSDKIKNRGAHGDSSFMLDGVPSSSENPPDLSVGSVKITVKKNPNVSVKAYDSLEGEDREKWLERIAKAILSGGKKSGASSSDLDKT